MSTMKSTRLRRKAVAQVSNARWVAYATAGAATAIAGVNTAEADIHYSGVINQVFNAPPGTFAYATLPLAAGASSTPIHYRFSSGTRGFAGFAVHGAVSGAFNGFYSGGFPYVSRLMFGQNPATHPFISPTSGALPGYGTLAFGSGYANSQWLSAGIGFVGLRFNTGSGVQYGWARLNMDGSPGNSFTLVDYAWGDVGTPITAGQIPEPGSLGLLALGAAGLVAWRKRRSQGAAAA
jgi:hypothetical protein